jgi:choline dehydrogenase-like flavoprotein
VIGSGIVGTTIATLLTQQGHHVDLFEKGPAYPYPHKEQFSSLFMFNHYDARYDSPSDLKSLVLSGDYKRNLNDERHFLVGGTANFWWGICLRMAPDAFKTKSTYGYGADWPLTYDDLEPYYSKAEWYLGVAGSEHDNPFAPWRSKPYPQPPFALGYDDLILADRLRANGIVLHTTPQARTRVPFDGRPACANFGSCTMCPLGARYSPGHHLTRALETGRCTLHPNTAVRRIVVESGIARSLVYQSNGDPKEHEHAADVIVVASGTIETARLLLLSGIDNEHIGKNLVFHHLFWGGLTYKENLYVGRIGPSTGESHQFLYPKDRKQSGGVKIQFNSYPAWDATTGAPSTDGPWKTSGEAVSRLETALRTRAIFAHAESVASDRKYVALSAKKDRFGDRFAAVHYELNDFDHETYKLARTTIERFAKATDATNIFLDGVEDYDGGHHHMGTCRMGTDARDSVVDSLGRVHGVSNLLVSGGSTFAGASPVNPTLTMVALAFRTSEYLNSKLS